MELLHAGGIFARVHAEVAGTDIPFHEFDPTAFDSELVDIARAVWADRVQTEFRSIQVMCRFLTEVLGAGDPLEVYAGAADAILDEIRHTALCVGMLEALGGTAVLPTPLVEEEHADFLGLPMAQRALSTAISMLAISETLSTGFITDLAGRCTQPVVRAVLDRTLADEETHHAFGWAYVEASMSRFDGDAIANWRLVADVTLEPHHQRAEAALAEIPPSRRLLAAWPEPELVELGLLSPQREALVFQETYRRELGPRLARLGLV